MRGPSPGCERHWSVRARDGKGYVSAVKGGLVIFQPILGRYKRNYGGISKGDEAGVRVRRAKQGGPESLISKRTRPLP